ncbi:hypothetical protein BK124_11400 [Paenibacillus amylolyticus]|uniref:hypothetical protein n=1 Tax=Paenibacillus amylolyticus TaxID=1451 RepID=UPI00096D827E|nr:hypothetical protein [Paenibacillus amylolyticus]OMF00258.1 hypothetical protein BK124_11400 [Paenibacillus amylolyticus]
MPNLKLAVDNNMTRGNVVTFKDPKPKPAPIGPTCGCCGGEADYMVFDQPHCQKHMLEAIDCKEGGMVRPIGGGGYDDAS